MLGIDCVKIGRAQLLYAKGFRTVGSIGICILHNYPTSTRQYNLSVPRCDPFLVKIISVLILTKKLLVKYFSSKIFDCVADRITENF